MMIDTWVSSSVQGSSAGPFLATVVLKVTVSWKYTDCRSSVKWSSDLLLIVWSYATLRGYYISPTRRKFMKCIFKHFLYSLKGMT